MTMDLLTSLPPHVRQVISLIADTADGAFVVSLDCQFLAWSWRAQKLFGFSSSEILGRHCYDILPARDGGGQCLCTVNCPMVTAARCGFSTPPTDTQIWAKGGRPVWVRVSPIVLRKPYGTSCAVLVVVTDVSQYKRAELTARLIESHLYGATACAAPPAADAVAMLRSSFHELTQREAEVLWEAIAGQDYHEVAKALRMSPTTARNHLQRILAKLGVHSQRQAVLKAMLALVAPPPSP
jgi:DNA-binding CsgD family transcriptional regulator